MPRLYCLWESKVTLCSFFLGCSSPSVSKGVSHLVWLKQKDGE